MLSFVDTIATIVLHLHIVAALGDLQCVSIRLLHFLSLTAYNNFAEVLYIIAKRGVKPWVSQ